MLGSWATTLIKIRSFTMKEVEREIENYEGLYTVSDMGNVYSYRRGKKYKMVGQLNHRGYHVVGLTKNKQARGFMVHRLVASAFIPSVDGKDYVNHKDFSKLNNCVDNLEWMTHRENLEHSWEHKRQKPKYGSNHGRSKLDEMQVLTVCTLLGNKNWSQKRIAEHYNFTPEGISCINTGVVWSWMTGNSKRSSAANKNRDYLKSRNLG